MGREKYLKDIEALFRKSAIVRYNSLSKVVLNKKKVTTYPKKIVHNLLKKGTIKRITKGCYTLLDDPSLAVFCFQPAYLGLQDALSIHHLWEQETIPVVITTLRVRQGIRTMLGSNVLMRRIDKKYFFGLEYFQQDTIALPYTDIEKTFIDMLYFKEHLSDEVLRELRKRIERKKLMLYLKKYPFRFRERVIRCYKDRRSYSRNYSTRHK